MINNTVKFKPRNHVRVGRIVSVLSFGPNGSDVARGYAWIRAGFSVHTMRARFDANGTLVATAPDGTRWDAEGWTSVYGQENTMAPTTTHNTRIGH